MSCPPRLLTRTLNNHCLAVPGCKRHRAPGYTACRLHTNRKHRNGTYHAVLRLTQSRAHPYIGAAFSWLREAVRLNDPQVMLALAEFDTLLRQCPLVYLHDLGNKRLDARRKAKGILANVLKRFPDGYQAACAVLSVAMAVELACRVEPGMTNHPAFVQAMMRLHVYSLCNRQCEAYKLSTHRPTLASRWLNVRLHEILAPFVKYLSTDSRARDRAILERVATFSYVGPIPWRFLRGKRQRPYLPSRVRSDKGKPNPRKGPRVSSERLDHPKQNKKEIENHVSQER